MSLSIQSFLQRYNFRICFFILFPQLFCFLLWMGRLNFCILELRLKLVWLALKILNLLRKVLLLSSLLFLKFFKVFQKSEHWWVETRWAFYLSFISSSWCLCRFCIDCSFESNFNKCSLILAILEGQLDSFEFIIPIFAWIKFCFELALMQNLSVY